jgi:hypothetical protein
VDNVMDWHCSGEIEAAVIFSNEGKDRKSAKLFMV